MWLPKGPDVCIWLMDWIYRVLWGLIEAHLEVKDGVFFLADLEVCIALVPWINSQKGISIGLRIITAEDKKVCGKQNIHNA